MQNNEIPLLTGIELLIWNTFIMKNGINMGMGRVIL
jgi:hypothetical protein